MDDLLGVASPSNAVNASGNSGSGSSGDVGVRVAIGKLQPGKFQPRQTFSEATLQELATSIRENGMIQPLIVRPADSEGHYEIIAGERRWRAAQLLSLSDVPVMVRSLDDEEALSWALVENIQREDLNPIEQARSMAQLADQFSLTHEKIAKIIGCSRPAVTNMLRLLELDERVQRQVCDGELTMAHARCLIGLSPMRQRDIANRTIKGGWTVRSLEGYVKRERDGKAAKMKPTGGVVKDFDTENYAESVSKQTGLTLSLRHNRAGDGKIVIRYGSLRELDDIVNRLRST